MRKFRMGFAAVLLVFFCLCSVPVSALEETAEDLSGDASFFLNDAPMSAAVLTDKKNSTKITVESGDRLKITAESPFSFLYLSFDRPPDPYVLLADGKEQACGEWGFLHELVELPSPVSSVELILPGGILCGVSLYSEGALPEDVQQWEPPYACEEAGQEYQGCDMLVFPTHADDDQLWFGPAIATYAAQGKTIQVAYLTNHWSEPYRPHELLNGLWTSGVRAYPILPEFPDYYSESLEHAKTLYDVDAMEEYMVSLIRQFRPSVVVGHDLNGEYGHGVHMLNAWLVTRTVEGSGDSEFYPDSAEKYGVYEVPKTYLHLYETNPITLEIETPLEFFEGKSAFEVAQEGYACHVSQQQYWFKVFKSGPYDARRFGLYRSTVGSDTSNDMFENIPPRPDPVSSEADFSELEESQPSAVSDTPSSEPDPDLPEGSEHDIQAALAVFCLALAVVAAIVGILIVLRKKNRGK